MYESPQKNFSICHGTYSTIPDTSKNQSVKLKEEVNGGRIEKCKADGILFGFVSMRFS